MGIIIITGKLRSVKSEKYIASVNIEKSGPTIDPWGTLRKKFK